MQNKSNEISEHFLDFAAAVIKLIVKLSRTLPGKHIGGQLTRSATSAGANYQEACGAESRADFIHKMQIVLKELNESLYWLKLIERSRLLATEEIQNIMSQCEVVTRIVAKSIITAKSNR